MSVFAKNTDCDRNASHVAHVNNYFLTNSHQKQMSLLQRPHH